MNPHESSGGMAAAFAGHQARHAAQVLHKTFGHLEPLPRVTYTGHVVFGMDEFGLHFVLRVAFCDPNGLLLESSPGFHEDLMGFVNQKLEQLEHRQGCMVAGQLWKFEGNYMRFHNGNCRFSVTGKRGAVKYRLYESDGRLVREGECDPQIDVNILDLPGHGAISLEVAPDRWLTRTTTEWAVVYLRGVPGDPEHHATPSVRQDG